MKMVRWVLSLIAYRSQWPCGFQGADDFWQIKQKSGTSIRVAANWHQDSCNGEPKSPSECNFLHCDWTMVPHPMQEKWGFDTPWSLKKKATPSSFGHCVSFPRSVRRPGATPGVTWTLPSERNAKAPPEEREDQHEGVHGNRMVLGGILATWGYQ